MGYSSNAQNKNTERSLDEMSLEEKQAYMKRQQAKLAYEQAQKKKEANKRLIIAGLVGVAVLVIVFLIVFYALKGKV